MSKLEIVIILFILAAATGILLTMFRQRPVPPFTDDNCIQALIGEDAGDDYEGMKLMAHALRNRKTLKGVYGFYASHIETESRGTRIKASTAWFDSLNEFDPLRGASEWRSIDDVYHYGHPKKMHLIKIHNGILYYKPSK